MHHVWSPPPLVEVLWNSVSTVFLRLTEAICVDQPLLAGCGLSIRLFHQAFSLPRRKLGGPFYFPLLKHYSWGRLINALYLFLYGVVGVSRHCPFSPFLFLVAKFIFVFTYVVYIYMLPAVCDFSPFSQVLLITSAIFCSGSMKTFFFMKGHRSRVLWY